MKIIIETYQERFRSQYLEFINKNKHFLWYCSLEYKKLLESYMNVSSYYILAFVDNQVKGCLPLMISEEKYLGSVINSLPYYGSNGSFLLDVELSKEKKFEIAHLIYNYLNEFIKSNPIISTTFISNPLDSFSTYFFDKINDEFIVDYRVGQLTPLPSSENEINKLLSNPRPRNIRKAIKEGVKVYKSNSVDDFDFLYKTHYSNITSINGIPKEKKFFELIQDIVPKKNYSLFIAEKDGEKVSGLLVFYFNETVEYFTPCSVYKYRNYQSSSLLIYEAMKDAIRKKYKFWNWGGTWESQQGVYDFKKKWGAFDKKYFYYTKVTNQEVFLATKEKLQEEYKNFFVIPYKLLNKKEN